MANGFREYSRDVAVGTIQRRNLGAASTQFNTGDACKFTNGTITPCSAQTDKPYAIFSAMETPAASVRPATAGLTTTKGEKILSIPCRGNHTLWETDLTGSDAPPINGTAVNSGTTTTALVTAAGSTSDYIGGIIYFPLTNTHHHVTGDTVSGGVHTFTFVPAAPRALAAGDTAIVVPFAPFNSSAVKLSSAASAASQGISCAVADKTGGVAMIEEVNLSGVPKARVSFPYLI